MLQTLLIATKANAAGSTSDQPKRCQKTKR
jgi:hypothetical protein